MNHPTAEEWMSFVYGEADEAQRATLDGHLATCSECQAQVAEWRAAGIKLDSWKLPKTTRSIRFAAPVVKWGLAACLALTFGFMAVRSQADHQTVAQLRDELTGEAARREAELRDVRNSISSLVDAAKSQALADFKAHVQRSHEQALAAAAAQTERLVTEMAKSVSANRASDQEMIAAMLTQLESRRVEEMAILRKELETMAILTEANFERAQNRFVQLAAVGASNLEPKNNP